MSVDLWVRFILKVYNGGLSYSIIHTCLCFRKLYVQWVPKLKIMRGGPMEEDILECVLIVKKNSVIYRLYYPSSGTCRTCSKLVTSAVGNQEKGIMPVPKPSPWKPTAPISNLCHGISFEHFPIEFWHSFCPFIVLSQALAIPKRKIKQHCFDDHSWLKSAPSRIRSSFVPSLAALFFPFSVMSCDFFAGWVGGCCGILFGHPFDTLKVINQKIWFFWFKFWPSPWHTQGIKLSNQI